MPDGQGCNALAPSQTSPGATSHLQKLPCPGMTSHDGNSCFLQAAGGTEGWKFHTPFPPSMFLPYLSGTSVLCSRLAFGLHYLSTSEGSKSL